MVQRREFASRRARWRLANDIHAACYHAYGVEVSASPLGEESVAIRTPHCRIGNLTLGTIDEDLVGDPEVAIADWSAFRRRAFTLLNVPSFASTPHLGCFHRRAKARYDLCYRVCVWLAEATEGEFSFRGIENADSPLFDSWRVPVVIPSDKPIRFLGVTSGDSVVGVLRTDGLVITPSTSWPIEERILKGYSLKETAIELLTQLVE